MSIAVVVGLGNPGLSYARTRHNLGYRLVEALAPAGAVWKTDRSLRVQTAPAEVAGRPVTLLKALSYMNDSGRGVGAYARYHKLAPAAFAVAYDEIALVTGEVKVSVSGSAGGHNGIRSLLAELGDGFARYRVGIGPKSPPQIDLADYVLGPFLPDEEGILAARWPALLDGLRRLVADGPLPAMNFLNQRKKSSSP